MLLISVKVKNINKRRRANQDSLLSLILIIVNSHFIIKANNTKLDQLNIWYVTRGSDREN